MQAVRQKWQLYRTYQRLQRLWDEYILASSQDEAIDTLDKLDSFLTDFQESHNGWLQATPTATVHSALDKIYGDCGEVVVHLLYTAERIVNQHYKTWNRHREEDALLLNIVTKSLTVVELILQDERYRRVVFETPNLVNRILSLMARIESPDMLRRALHIVLALSVDEPGKLEIGRQRGFYKILRLTARNPTLLEEIIRVTKRLSEACHDPQLRVYWVDQLNKTISRNETVSAQPSIMLGDKVSSLVMDVRERMTLELGRVLLQFGASGVARSEPSKLDMLDQETLVQGEEIGFIPCAEQVASWLNLLVPPEQGAKSSVVSSERAGELASTVDDSAVDEPSTLFGRWRSFVGLGQGPNTDNTTYRSSAAHDADRNEEHEAAIQASPIDEQSAHSTLRGLMRRQGVLSKLADILRHNHLGSEARLDIVETMCTLIFDDPAGRQEFCRYDGYNVLLLDLSRPMSTSTQSSTTYLDDATIEETWWQDYFNLLFTVTLGPAANMRISDCDMLDMLSRAATHSSILSVRQHAIYCIQDMVSLNTFNAAACWKYGAVDHFLTLLTKAVTVLGSEAELAKVLGVHEDSLTMLTDDRITITSAGSLTTALERIVYSSKLYQYLASITWLLEYFSVVLGEHNQHVLQEYTRIVMQVELPSYSIAVGLVLRSVGRILTDLHSRGRPVQPKFLNIFLQLLCRAYAIPLACTIEADDIHMMTELSGPETTVDWKALQCRDADQQLMAQEQYLALLQICGLLLGLSGRDMESFSMNQGFEAIHYAIAHSTTLCWRFDDGCSSDEMCLEYNTESERLVCDMALWMMRECLVSPDSGHDSIKWLVKLLKLVLATITSSRRAEIRIPVTQPSENDNHHVVSADRPFRFMFDWFHIKLCQLLSSIFRICPAVKRPFVEQGGIEAILAIFSQTNNVSVATEALVAIGDLFVDDCESFQVVGESFGHEGLMELVLSSQRPLDRLACHVLLEVATVGNLIRHISLDVVADEPFHLSNAVVPFIASLLAPAKLFRAPLPICFWRNSGFRIPPTPPRISSPSLIENPTSTYWAQGRKGRSASRPSSLFSDHSRRGKDTTSLIGEAIRGHETNSLLSMRPRSIAGPLMDQHTEALVEGLTDNPLGEISSPRMSIYPESSTLTASRPTRDSSDIDGQRGLEHSVRAIGDDNSSPLSDTSFAQRLAGITFRGPEAARMALKLIFRIPLNCEALRTYYFELFLQLLHTSSRNQQLVCQLHGFELTVRSMISEALSHEQDDASFNTSSSLCTSLIGLLGGYDIGPGGAALLLNSIYDPVRIVDGPPSSNTATVRDSVTHRPANAGLTQRPTVSTQLVGYLQRQLLIALMDISSHLEPQYFFCFDGCTGAATFPLDNLPSPRTGYSLSLWLKVSAFFGEKTGLLGYTSCQEDDSYFELYLRALPQSDRYCLCVRTQQQPMPPEDFVFYNFDFAAMPGWHNIILTHSREELGIFVDGQLLQTYASFSYPRASSKEKLSVGILGSCSATATASVDGEPFRYSTALTSGQMVQLGDGVQRPAGDCCFCGKMSSVYFLEGILDASMASRIYSTGLRAHGEFRVIGIENREAITIDPHVICPPSASAAAVNTASPPDAPVGKWRGLVSGPDLSKPSLTVLRGCTIHHVRHLTDVIRQIGGPQICLPLLEGSPENQLIGMSVIASLLLQAPDNRELFRRSSGFAIIRYLLQTSKWGLTVGHFELMLDIACDGHLDQTSRVLAAWDGVQLYVDLLPYAPHGIQLQAVRLLVDTILDVRGNLTWWRNETDIVLLFDLLQVLPATLHQFLFRLLDAMMEQLSEKELHQLLDFVAFEKRQFLELKCDLLDLLLRHITWSVHLTELLWVSGGPALLISLLDLPNERFRLLVLKLIGVSMSLNTRQSRQHMTKIGGFDGMWLFLAPFAVTSELVQTLLGMALNFYRCDDTYTEVPAASGRSMPPHTTRLAFQLTDQLVYPELIRLILELLRSCDNIDLIIDLLADMKRLLTASNMAILWDHPWSDWLAVFLEDREVMEKSNYGRIATMLFSIAQRLMVFDVARRGSVIGKLKGAVADSETFQLRLVDDVLAFYERRPRLDPELAHDVLKNLAILYRHLDEFQPPNASLLLRFAACLNLIACHNDSDIRNTMKSLGLFAIRDMLITNLLQADLTTPEQLNIFRNFSFEMLADQPRFCESHGLLLLMRAFHNADPNVRLAIARVLLAVFRPSAASRRALAMIIEDHEVIRRFFTVSLKEYADDEFTRSSLDDDQDFADDIPRLLHRGDNDSTQPLGRTSPRGSLSYQQPMSLTDFMTWYFRSDPDAVLRRTKIEQRIEKLYVPIAMMHRRSQERVVARRHKRIQQCRERHLRHASSLNRALAELKSKGKQRIEVGGTNHMQRIQELHAARADRFGQGEECWGLRIHNTGSQILRQSSDTG